MPSENRGHLLRALWEKSGVLQGVYRERGGRRLSRTFLGAALHIANSCQRAVAVCAGSLPAVVGHQSSELFAQGRGLAVRTLETSGTLRLRRARIARAGKLVRYSRILALTIFTRFWQLVLSNVSFLLWRHRRHFRCCVMACLPMGLLT